MRKHEEDYMAGNLVAMIDIVFQLIIFFVCTTNLQDSMVNAEIELPMAPHGKVQANKDPLEINVEVNKKGVISIARTRMSQGMLLSILKKAVGDFGQRVPVVIRADGDVKHTDIKKVMDAASSAGLARVEFAALKESSSGKK
jgi:biopolymer transport protein ExbD